MLPHGASQFQALGGFSSSERGAGLSRRAQSRATAGAFPRPAGGAVTEAMPAARQRHLMALVRAYRLRYDGPIPSGSLPTNGGLGVPWRLRRLPAPSASGPSRHGAWGGGNSQAGCLLLPPSNASRTPPHSPAAQHQGWSCPLHCTGESLSQNH